VSSLPKKAHVFRGSEKPHWWLVYLRPQNIVREAPTIIFSTDTRKSWRQVYIQELQIGGTVHFHTLTIIDVFSPRKTVPTLLVRNLDALMYGGERLARFMPTDEPFSLNNIRYIGEDDMPRVQAIKNIWHLQ
jgi:hypothetical protein